MLSNTNVAEKSSANTKRKFRSRVLAGVYLAGKKEKKSGE